MATHIGNIVLAPRITEKGAYLSEKGAYVFAVGRDANKIEIAQAIRTLYKVTPRKVNIVTIPRKTVTTRGTNRRGKTATGKKAYVYLKKGETIEII
jgi:large subunit ribosomal protein L23